MSNKYTEKTVRLWLENNYPRYNLVYWAGSAGKKSKFLDKTRNVTFECVFYNLKSRLKKNPNHLFAPTKEEINKKREETSYKAFGVSHALKLKFFQNKQQQTNLKRRGVNFPSQSETVKQKTKQTNLKKYGEISASKTDATKEKTKKTNIKKYGYDTPTKNILIKKKTINTLRKKFANENIVNISQCPEVQKKIKETKKSKGQIRLINGKSLREIAQEKGCGYTTLTQKYNAFGPKFVLNYDLSQTQIEQRMCDFLNQLKIDFIQDKKLKSAKYRPDFILPKHNLIIECDGLYWHSDAKVNKTYHYNKKKLYAENGYISLFFREDEIITKFPIIESIIQNKLGLSKRIFARKCLIQNACTNNSFFEENHLMGKGQGRIYSLVYEGKIGCAIQVKWKNKKEKMLEISRFAPRLGCSIVGGFSKLVSHVIKTEQPNKIITFIDLRYGSGTYLKNLGWKHSNTSLSFKWCKNQQSINRLNFRNNSGYEYGFLKIWDCGQAKYEFDVENCAYFS